MEHWNLSLYDLDGPGMLVPVHQLNCLEIECDQLGACVVRYL